MTFQDIGTGCAPQASRMKVRLLVVGWSKRPAAGRRQGSASHPEVGRLLAGGLAYTLKVCTHITAIRRGVATVKPATPESLSEHGHIAPYRVAIPRPVRHCCHVDHDVTHGGLSVRPVGGGPLLPERHPRAAWPPIVGQGCGRLPIAGYLPPSKHAPH